MWPLYSHRYKQEQNYIPTTFWFVQERRLQNTFLKKRYFTNVENNLWKLNWVHKTSVVSHQLCLFGSGPIWTRASLRIPITIIFFTWIQTNPHFTLQFFNSFHTGCIFLVLCHERKRMHTTNCCPEALSASHTIRSVILSHLILIKDFITLQLWERTQLHDQEFQSRNSVLNKIKNTSHRLIQSISYNFQSKQHIYTSNKRCTVTVKQMVPDSLKFQMEEDGRSWKSVRAFWFGFQSASSTSVTDWVITTPHVLT